MFRERKVLCVPRGKGGCGKGLKLGRSSNGTLKLWEPLKDFRRGVAMIRNTCKTSRRAVVTRAGLEAQRGEEVIVVVQVGRWCPG